MKNEPSDSVVHDQKLSGTSYNPINIDLASPDTEPKYDPTKYRLDYTNCAPTHSKDSKSHMRCMLGLTSNSIFSMSSFNKKSPKHEREDERLFDGHIMRVRPEQSSSLNSSLTVTYDSASSLDASLIITSEIPPQTANHSEVQRSHDPSSSSTIPSPPSLSSDVTKESSDKIPSSTVKRDRMVENPLLQVSRKRRKSDYQEYNGTATTPSVGAEDEIKFIPFTGRPKGPVPAGPHTDVGIFWDIENLRVPCHVHPASLITELRKRVVDCQPHFREAIFYVVCDVYRENKALINQLFEFHVRVVHVPGMKQNTSDNVLRDLMVEFVGHHAGKSPRVVLLSGDSDFSHDIFNFTRKEKCDVVLVHNPQAKDSLIKSASSAFLFQSLFPPQELQQYSESSEQSNPFLNNPPQYENKHRYYNAPKIQPRRFPASSTSNTTFGRLPDYVPVQSRTQAFYRQAKKKMLGNVRMSPRGNRGKKTKQSYYGTR